MTKPKAKYIELIGIGLPNRGAELLVRAVIQACIDEYGDCVFATAQKLPEKELRKLGLKRCLRNGAGSLQTLIERLIKKTGISKRRKISYRPFSWLSREQRDKLGIVLEQDIDLIVDASGFAYGDFWGSAKAQRRLEDRRKMWQSMQKPLVFLPQSFGPFEQPGFEVSLKPSLEMASCVCVRDKKSADYLSKFTEKARLYPDITFLLNGITIPKPQKPYSLFIPNSKVMESGVVSRDEYLEMARRFITLSRQLDCEPILLNHEGAKDLELCQELARSEQVNILDPEDALVIKATIANAEFVFSSRYHGVVSSLSTGTPVLVFGWSHKYRELLQDFGIEQWLIENPLHAEEVMIKFCQHEQLETIKQEIAEHLPSVKQQLTQMWRWIFDTVRSEP
ncbi:polysaccharide pyruvyl transferase family protein [Neptuniibacter sp. CAU 1671]|uniref:polysaccharide pyruvyl transferase family protein n=1 Tax=Neptuniibacter sp. CAU 1671 TaxID=3032593 RepID=UPI0023DA0EA6|nr:polysaccharide pyruvyl transferase family protein [Neptuniibacter sp. CAU 1671]MDF2182171.1 polysaccharide pyruvyl transferase family protein [Neptuniibacter sp. CAU 1671]